MDIKQIGRFVFGTTIAVALVPAAFQVGILFGAGFLVHSVYAAYNGEFSESPGAAIMFFVEDLVEDTFDQIF